MEKQHSNPFEKLAVELLVIILSKLPDVLSLRSAALSCRKLFNAVRGAETLTTTRVLLNQMEDVLPEAIITQETSRFKTWTDDQIQGFIATHLGKRLPPPKTWTLSDAVPIAKFDGCVSELASHFIATTATKSTVCVNGFATRTEESRIRRAMYRFEIFCNLFRGMEKSDPEPLWDTFFLCFSPWENEQLACVHDYLVRAVSPAFNDIAEHDVAWGNFNVAYDDQRDSVFIQQVLAYGLEKLRRISMAKTYETRYELLYSGPHPGSRFQFLYEALNHANRRDDAIYMEDFSPTIERTHIRPPFFDDSDTGPADGWRWAHKCETWAHFVNQDSRETLREWGYVMWDRARLEEQGIFHSDWEPPVPNDENTRANDQRHAEMLMSWDARSKIYRTGGLGWWSFGDESKIIWPNRKIRRERQASPTYAVPSSLEEARDMLRSTKLPGDETEKQTVRSWCAASTT